ncbi:hypothetical protein D9M69_606430 [compost metagenome]
MKIRRNGRQLTLAIVLKAPFTRQKKCQMSTKTRLAMKIKRPSPMLSKKPRSTKTLTTRKSLKLQPRY